jgi:acetylornithine/N-succinyldiaminopimelate aminotransferase
MKSTQELEKDYIINTYNRQPGFTPCLVRGEGSYVWDDQGKRYLDLLGGLAVNLLGHCHPRVVEAVCRQVSVLSHTSNLYYSGPQVELAAELIRMTGNSGRVFFANSGAEANEAAFKLVRKHRPGRYKVIAAQRSFHGRTFAALTATGQIKYRQAFEPLVEGFSYATFNDLSSFEKLIDDQTAAIIIEPIQGEGGIYPADPSFIEGLRQLCDREGLLLIFDEVQCGMGRTGKLWAYENWAVSPDLITAAKGLGGGLPLGVLIVAQPYADLFQPGDHASTFGGNPVVCSAALAVLEVLREPGFLAEVQARGEAFKRDCEILQEKYPALIKEFRGLGLICALEMHKPLAKEIQEKCVAEGLLINAIGDTTLRFLPPLNVSQEELQQGLAVLNDLLSAESKAKKNL